ncbi:uncharacterized protein N7515_000501 [Penicillium bovifimosum]|uniref:Uncharacterized protein n=1 Tax=Penicillium bovifimosum TaxID=126998 RepID=A0A9W9HI99_9EURO|nr:uncharacterized protein N7515_000501 [Penicillium bovifimosum]KAJ5145937.1 hypothetical protein N7515_000501 [Penicillium bovifimosum]
MHSGPNHTINWGAYREGVQSELPKFKSLPHDGLKLTESYQAVLGRQETFTQYFSDEPLESYKLESRLRETLGISPSASGPSTSKTENDPSLSWVGIFRDGVFEKQPDGSYHCDYQGKTVNIDESLHRSILVNRCFITSDSNPLPSTADVEKEAAITLAIEADVLDELDGSFKYIERLKRLQLALRRRRIKLEGIRGPIKTPHTPQTPGSQCLRRSESRPAIDIGFKTRLRSLSESSGLSSGSDIPHTNVRDESEQVSSNGHEDTVVHSSQQKRSTPAINSKGSPVHPLPSGTRSSPPIPPSLTKQTRDDAQGSRQTQQEKPAKHHLNENQGAMHPPPKKQKIEMSPPPPDLRALNASRDMATTNEKLDKPAQQQIGPEKPRNGNVRTRKNFTEYEKEHAPAWFKAQRDSKTTRQIEKAYFERFGVYRRFIVLKAFVERMDKKAGAEKAATSRTATLSTQSDPASRDTSAVPSLRRIAPSPTFYASPPSPTSYESPYPNPPSSYASSNGNQSS